MNRAIAALIVLYMLLASTFCYAAEYQLTVNNNTSELFMVQTESQILAELYPNETAKVYHTQWRQNNAGAWIFNFRFIAKSGVGLEVYVMGARSGASQRVFCSSGSIRYACQLIVRDDASANLVISYH